MAKTRVKTKYEEEGAYGSTEIKTLYCFHNHSGDYFEYFDEHGETPIMIFNEWSDNNMWSAMLLLSEPYKKDWTGELKEGVEYYIDSEIGR